MSFCAGKLPAIRIFFFEASFALKASSPAFLLAYSKCSSTLLLIVLVLRAEKLFVTITSAPDLIKSK